MIFFCISRNRSGSISLLEFKQLMVILCNTQTFEQFVGEEFTIACDHNRCVNRFRFESILKVISKLFSYLEDNAYYRSQQINDIVHECFEQVCGIFFTLSCIFLTFFAIFSHYMACFHIFWHFYTFSAIFMNFLLFRHISSILHKLPLNSP